jgi:hypothetical protein
MCIVCSNGVAELVIADEAKEHRITHVPFCVIVRDLGPIDGPIRDSLLMCC